MKAAVFALGLVACGRAEDQIFVSGPIEYLRVARLAAQQCGARTMRIEAGTPAVRLIVGNDIGPRGAECVVAWVQSHEVSGSAIELKGGGPI